MLNEARGLLSEKLKVINIILLLFFFLFFFFHFFYAKVIPPISYTAASKILISNITDFKFHTHRLRASLLVRIQLKQVISHAAKENNKTS
jgi:hypothetical protein